MTYRERHEQKVEEIKKLPYKKYAIEDELTGVWLVYKDGEYWFSCSNSNRRERCREFGTAVGEIKWEGGDITTPPETGLLKSEIIELNED